MDVRCPNCGLLDGVTLPSQAALHNFLIQAHVRIVPPAEQAALIRQFIIDQSQEEDN